MRILLLALVLAPALAHADPKRAPLGNGYELVIGGDSRLEVQKAGQRARLADAWQITKVAVVAGKIDVAVDAYDCAMSHHYTWTFAELDARLANTAAFALHQKKDFKAAAAGFAKAAALDPAWRIPAYNAASALQLAGDKPGAVAALAPWLASEPVTTYVQVTSDPELAPLLDRPELRAVRAKKPGTASVTIDGVTGGVAYAADRKLIAVARDEASWGATVFTRSLEIYDTAGKLVAATPIVKWDETAPACDVKNCIPKSKRAAIVARAARLEAMLRELGFSPATVENGSAVVRDESKTKTTFARAKLGIVALGGTARVLRGNTELATASVLEYLERAAYVTEIRSIVAWSIRPGAEGCEGTDPTQVTVIAVP